MIVFFSILYILGIAAIYHQIKEIKKAKQQLKRLQDEK